MKSLLLCLTYVLLGGLAFWVPDVLLRTLKSGILSKRDIWILTFALPLFVIAVHTLLRRSRNKVEKGPSIALYMCLGIWILGPTAMVISASFSHEGFSNSDNLMLILFGTFFPPFTYVMSTYDGSLLALLLTTILLPALHLIYEMNSWVLPPPIFRAIRKWLGL